jgi:hypothetical protein
MMNNNTLIDLFVRIKDLLWQGRLDVVYKVANNQSVEPKLRETFRSLADLFSQKYKGDNANNADGDFYRASVARLIEHGGISSEEMAE